MTPLEHAIDLAAVVDRFGLGADAVRSPGPVARGEQGQIWRVDTTAGAWAVKELFASTTEDEVRASADLQDAAHAAGVPTPRTVRTADGAVLTALDDVAVRVYTWVDLEEPDPNLDPAAVGRMIAAIHQLDVRISAEQHPWYVEPVGAEKWDDLLASLAREGASFAGALASLRDELVALESLLEPAPRLQACHLDLWADNIRRTPDGGLCVFDWDNAGPGDPSRELALVLYEFAYDDLERARSLHDAYVSAGGPGRVRRRGDFSMLIAQLGHITEMACERWLDQGPTPRDHNEMRVAELTSRPLTRVLIDRIIEAIQAG